MIVNLCIFKNVKYMNGEINLDSPIEELDCKYKKFHCPVFLTLNDFQINNYGCYNNYINAGDYICKFIDYNRQVTSDELENYNINETYTFISRRYKKIFPFSKLDLTKSQSEIPSGSHLTKILSK